MAIPVNYQRTSAEARSQIPSDWKGHCKIADANLEDQEAFFNVRDRFLCERGLGDHLDEIKDFAIPDYSKRVASYTNPLSGEKEYIHLFPEEIKDPETRAAVAVLYERAEAFYGKDNISKYHFAHFSKGDRLGKRSIDRSTIRLKGFYSEVQKENNQARYVPTPLESLAKEKLLPATLDDIKDEAQRKRILRRHLFADFFTKKTKGVVEKKITDKQVEYDGLLEQGPADNAGNLRAITLKKELDSLRKLKEKLDRLDTYALSRAICFPRAGHWQRDLDGASEKLEAQVLEDLQSHADENYKKKFRIRRREADRQLTEQDKAYAKDVAGMLYRNRGKYMTYCAEQDMPMKKESLADLIFGEVLAFEKAGGDYRSDGLKNGVLLRDFPESLQEEMEAELNGIAKLVNEKIPALDAIDIDIAEVEEQPDDENPAEPQPTLSDKITATYDAIDWGANPVAVAAPAAQVAQAAQAAPEDAAAPVVPAEEVGPAAPVAPADEADVDPVEEVQDNPPLVVDVMHNQQRSSSWGGLAIRAGKAFAGAMVIGSIASATGADEALWSMGSQAGEQISDNLITLARGASETWNRSRGIGQGLRALNG